MEKVNNNYKRVPLMYGVLPLTCYNNGVSAADINTYLNGILIILQEELLNQYVQTLKSEHPELSDFYDEVRDYVYHLRKFCGCEILKEYDEKNKTIAFVTYVSEEDKEIMQERCKGLNSIITSNPFAKVLYPVNGNEFDYLNENAKYDYSKLKSYFENSALHDIIRYPQGANIAPHNDDIEKKYSTECGYSQIQSEGKLDEKYEYNVSGNFDSCFEKGDKQRFQYSQKFGTKDPWYDSWCEVHDIGNFRIKMTLSPNEITMHNNVSVFRTMKETDRESGQYDDNFFIGLSTNCPIEMEYFEYYIIMPSKKRLLHFSDLCESYELFDLPDNWKIEDGLSSLDNEYPTVYMDDEDKKDIEHDLISSIMNSKKREKGITKILK